MFDDTAIRGEIPTDALSDMIRITVMSCIVARDGPFGLFRRIVPTVKNGHGIDTTVTTELNPQNLPFHIIGTPGLCPQNRQKRGNRCDRKIPYNQYNPRQFILIPHKRQKPGDQDK